jgi:exodeoxyribonuclease I
MAASFFFYDLETTGRDPARHRIMQFAGQRTDMDLNPIGEPINVLVALTDEVLPEPGALLVTGITPQKTKDEGYTEAEFLKIFHEQVLTPDTIIIGYNNINFDDKFMQCTLYRNMYDAYEWQWQEGRSRWDLLDVIRLTRALRPEGIEWPFDEHGVPTNKLDRITVANGIFHENAHDALSDVTALINVAKLIKDAQPKLFAYLLKNRDKKAVQTNIGEAGAGKPFVHTAFTYPKEVLHTSVATVISQGKFSGEYYVFDLRYDPEPWLKMSSDELRKHCQKTAEDRDEDYEFIPVKKLKCNQCPAVAPYDVLRADSEAQERINIDLGMVQRHLSVLRQHPEFGDRVAAALEREFEKDDEVECQLYDGFAPEGDKAKMATVRAADAGTLRGFDPDFSDKRLKSMLVRYKARNYPSSLSDEERAAWEQYRLDRVARDMPHFIKELQIAAQTRQDENDQYILEELRLYAESIMPAVDAGLV